MPKFLFIRHGKTQSNLERRYVGDPNEPLSKAGAAELTAAAQSGRLPAITALMAGPARRCRQTADILFPGMAYTICPMTEIDFGIFKHKNADELWGNADYEKWLATQCMGDIPGGDSVSAFKKKCCDNFMQIAEEAGEGVTALVVHGGNIMAVMEQFAKPRRNFYDYHIPNGGFILCRYENGVLTVEQESEKPPVKP